MTSSARAARTGASSTGAGPLPPARQARLGLFPGQRGRLSPVRSPKGGSEGLGRAGAPKSEPRGLPRPPLRRGARAAPPAVRGRRRCSTASAGRSRGATPCRPTPQQPSPVHTPGRRAATSSPACRAVLPGQRSRASPRRTAALLCRPGRRCRFRGQGSACFACHHHLARTAPLSVMAAAPAAGPHGIINQRGCRAGPSLPTCFGTTALFRLVMTQHQQPFQLCHLAVTGK